MSESKHDHLVLVMLGYDNWHLWDRHIKSTIRRKSAYIAFSPKPVDPSQLPATATPIAAPSTSTAATTSTTATATATAPKSTAEEMKKFETALEKWTDANEVAAGVILGAISDEVQHIIDSEDSAKDMYDTLKAEVVKQSREVFVSASLDEKTRSAYRDHAYVDSGATRSISPIIE